MAPQKVEHQPQSLATAREFRHLHERVRHLLDYVQFVLDSRSTDSVGNGARFSHTMASAVPAMMKLGGNAPGLIARIGLTRGSSSAAG